MCLLTHNNNFNIIWFVWFMGQVPNKILLFSLIIINVLNQLILIINVIINNYNISLAKLKLKQIYLLKMCIECCILSNL